MGKHVQCWFVCGMRLISVDKLTPLHTHVEHKFTRQCEYFMHQLYYTSILVSTVFGFSIYAILNSNNFSRRRRSNKLSLCALPKLCLVAVRWQSGVYCLPVVVTETRKQENEKFRRCVNVELLNIWIGILWWLCVGNEISRKFISIGKTRRLLSEFAKKKIDTRFSFVWSLNSSIFWRKEILRKKKTFENPPLKSSFDQGLVLFHILLI